MKCIKSHNLRIGDVILAPQWVMQNVHDLRGGIVKGTPLDASEPVPMAEIWPECPATLVVEDWGWREDGMARLANPDGDGSIEASTADMPEIVVLVTRLARKGRR